VRPGAYIRSRVPQLAVLLVLEGLLALVLCVTSASADLVALVLALVALAAALALGIGYRRDREFWGSVESLKDSPDAVRAARELMAEPHGAEARAASDAIVDLSKAAADEVAEQRRAVEEYRAYVETWVHEAKSPITAARLALANLEEEAPILSSVGAAGSEAPGYDSLVPRLRAVGDELTRVEGYIEQALFYARSETLDRDFLVRKYEFREIVSAAVRANASLLIGAKVTPRLGEGLSLPVFTDSKWLVFMLGQLLQNSARYARADAEGGPQVWFDARLVDEGLAAERVELAVRDNGRPAARLRPGVHRGQRPLPQALDRLGPMARVAPRDQDGRGGLRRLRRGRGICRDARVPREQDALSRGLARGAASGGGSEKKGVGPVADPSEQRLFAVPHYARRAYSPLRARIASRTMPRLIAKVTRK